MIKGLIKSTNLTLTLFMNKDVKNVSLQERDNIFQRSLHPEPQILEDSEKHRSKPLPSKCQTNPFMLCGSSKKDLHKYVLH